MCALCSTPGTAAQLEESEACLLPPGELKLSSIVSVTTAGGAHASGVVIAQDRVVTALHVVADAKTVSAEIRGFGWPARIVLEDSKSDLALLEVRTFNLEPLNLSPTVPRDAETLWAVGFPLAGERRVAAGEHLGSFGAKLKSSVQVAAGSSGGALLRCANQSFELAGMITGHTSGAERFALAVPAAEIRKLVDTAH